LSQDSTPEERTELPTDKRMGELRKEGAMHMSNEIPQVATLLAGFMILYFVWQWIFDVTQRFFSDTFRMIAHAENLDSKLLANLTIHIIKEFGPPISVVMLTVGAVAVLSVMLQTKWNIRNKWIKFKFDMLNPISGIKKVFSIHGTVNTGKALLKLTIILPLSYFALEGFAPKMIALMHMNITEVFNFTGAAMWSLFWKIMYILLFFMAFDFFWTKFQWLKQNKMTKDEVKDERKAQEGDEDTKRKMRNKGLKRIAERIYQSVQQADVVVTNPTHFAVALKYDRDNMSAPKVVAKGRGFLALRIRKIAKESGVPVLERKLLARALYASVEVGREIPNELFKAVAEVLAYVYKIRKPNFLKKKTQNGA
jgi:flagellar biosynthetic protein FlhB